MKAVVVEKPNQVVLREVSVPELRPQDVLVRVHWAGICGTDLDIVKGEIDLVTDGRIQYPVRIGHEWSGIVEQTGPEAKGVAPGDRVVCETAVSCGICPACLEGRYGECETGYRSIGTIDNPWPGSMAEYMVVPWWSLYKIPDRVPMDAAALAEPASIAFSAILDGRITEKDTALIIGTGAIGLAAVGLLHCLGVKNILVAGRQDDKLRIAMDMGATAVVNMRTGSFQEEIMTLTNDRGVDVLFESSGAVECVEQALTVLADKGRLLLYSFYTTSLRDFSIARLSSHSLSLIGVSVKFGTQMDILRWMDEGKLDLSALITHKLPFEKAPDILQNIDQYGKSRIKILLDVGGGEV